MNITQSGYKTGRTGETVTLLGGLIALSGKAMGLTEVVVEESEGEG